MTHAGINGRNPTPKRGRPKNPNGKRLIMAGMCRSRNAGDMVLAVARGLAPKLSKKLLRMADRGETTVTVLAYLARFPHDQQREMFQLMNRLGSRGAKRFWESVTQKPTPAQMADRVLAWVKREYPAVPLIDIADALQLATEELREAADGDEVETHAGQLLALIVATSQESRRRPAH